MTDHSTISILVAEGGPFDRALAEQARQILAEVLDRLSASCTPRLPQVAEVAAALGVHPRRAVRLLEAFGMRAGVQRHRVFRPRR